MPSPLEMLAQAQFSSLQPAEVTLVRAAETTQPACCGPSAHARDASNNPQFSETGDAAAGVAPWGTNREVRAEVIRWLCVNKAAKELVDPRGLQLLGARVTGTLDLRQVEIPFPVSLAQCRLTATAYFIGCTLPRLELNGSWTRSIEADGSSIKRSFYLRGARVEGSLSLNLAQIGATLTCEDATVTGQSDVAIWADGIKVGGDVLLRADSKPFRAQAAVRFVGAEITGDLDCRGGEFLHSGDECLLLERARVEGSLSFGAGTKLEGVLNLANAFAAGFEDETTCWPKSGGLKLDGFTYTSIAPRQMQSRLGWLKLDTSDATQPYRQLAKVMQDSGDSKHAVCVLIQMERKISAREKLRFLKAVIGYGYRPGNAVWLLIALWLIGCFFCWDGYRHGQIVPTDKDVFATVRAGHPAPSYYPGFQPIAYSLENTFPLVKLGQADKWQPLSYLRWITWIQVVLGWLFATLFVAGISGIVQHQ